MPAPPARPAPDSSRDVFATQLIEQTPPPGGALPRASAPPTDEVEEAARAYRRFRLGGGSEGDFLTAAVPARVSADAARVFADLHESSPASADRLAAAVGAFPETGTVFLGFYLESELGRGAFGRVYLARQGELAGRPVALKVAADMTGEPQTLAQLQHTNIVPVYSVHRAGPLQAVCMPFFGSVTLDDVVGGLRGRDRVPGSGEHFVSTLNQRRNSAAPCSVVAPSAPTAVPAPRQPDDRRTAVTNEILARLSKLSYAEAVLWLGARLADGLAHAHERGIVHRDLKPANVLLTDEGQPMLLDFNLAEDAAARAGASAARVGGTLPYMSPEQMEAFRSRSGTIDARSDVYALGLLLFELLAGRHPFPTPPGPVGLILPQMIIDRKAGPPSLRAASPGVSPAAEAIVLKCLAPDPADRYPTARAVQEDIERHLANLPLRHTREPSLRERARKWARRNPRLASTGAVVALSAVLVAGLAAAVWAREDRLVRMEAANGWGEFQKEKRALEVTLGVGTLDPEALDAGLAAADRTLGRYGLPGDAAWETRPAVQRLSEADRRALRMEMGELLFIAARATAIQAERGSPAAAADRFAAAVVLSERAVECYRANELPWAVRAQCDELRAKATGTPWTAQPPPPPRAVRDAYLAAADLAARGRYREALPLVRYAVQNQPDLFPARFVLANCYTGLGQDVKAEAAFDACVALAPDFPPALHGRGLARMNLENHAGAEADFSAVLRLRPETPAAWLDRADARAELGDYRGAITDLTAALNLGAPPAHVHYSRQRAWARLGDARMAALDAAAGARVPPTDERGWVARGVARSDSDPEGALADFDAALALNPGSRVALQHKATVLSDKLRRTADAVRVLDGVVEAHPDAVSARRQRGVLHARLGDRPKALADAGACLAAGREGKNLYAAARIYAQTARAEPNDRGEALKHLAAALSMGYGLDRFGRDPDLDPLRNEAEFKRIVAEAAARGR